MADAATSRRPRVLVVSLSDIALDARITRHVEFLGTDYDVVVAALGRSPAVPGEFVQLRSAPPSGPRRHIESTGRVALRVAGLHERAYWLDSRVQQWGEALRGALPVDAIVVSDLYMLPLAHELSSGTPVVFDAREHWTSESSSWTALQRLSMQNAHEWVVDRYVPRLAGMMTVSPGIVRDYAERTGVHASLVTNAPFFRPLSPSEVNEPIRLLHVGVADERRRLEDTIEAVRELGDRFTLDIALIRDNDCRRRIERLVASTTNVRMIPPVPQPELVTFANGYDIGVHYMPTLHRNHLHALPNKLFDYIQARLAVAIGPSPAMAEVVGEWECGIISAAFSPEAFTESLGSLTPDEVARLKQNSDRAAQILTAESNRNTVLALLRHARAT